MLWRQVNDRVELGCLWCFQQQVLGSFGTVLENVVIKSQLVAVFGIWKPRQMHGGTALSKLGGQATLGGLHARLPHKIAVIANNHTATLPHDRLQFRQEDTVVLEAVYTTQRNCGYTVGASA